MCLLIIDDKHARALGMMAKVVEEQGKLDEAVEWYEGAYCCDKSSATRLRNYAILMVRLDNFEREKVLFEEAVALTPTNGVLLGELADVLHTMDRYAEAAVVFERAMSCSPNNTVINNYAALLYKIGMTTLDRTEGFLKLKRANELLVGIADPDASMKANLTIIQKGLRQFTS